MWLERFVIVVTSLHRDFLPSLGDVLAYVLGLGNIVRLARIVLLLTLFLFLRVLPAISMSEMRS
jgi:molybdopterin-containing oxidoreductase family membrane subunit